MAHGVSLKKNFFNIVKIVKIMLACPTNSNFVFYKVILRKTLITIISNNKKLIRR